MDGVQKIAQEASKDPNTMVFFLAVLVVIACLQFVLKILEMKQSGKTSEAICGASGSALLALRTEIKNDTYRAADKVVDDQKEMKDQLSWLKGVHDVRDTNGRMIWWGDPELKSAIVEQTKAATELTHSFTHMNEAMREFCNKADKVLYQKSN